jgi:sulfoxide reductase heme-binding subunit YedZ
MLGLFTFFYALMHFMTFLWADHNFDVGAMWKDVLKRPFITVGFIAFVLLVPLAATSTNAMIKRLGRRWSQLHRLIYLIAPLAILHYWWMKAGKHNFEQPIIWGLVVAVLLGLRVVWSLNRTRNPSPSRSVRS